METKKCQVTLLQPKVSFLSETQYYEILEKNTGTIKVVNERDFDFNVSNGIVEEGMYSSDQFTETVEVTRTQLIEILGAVGDTVFSVSFNKMPTADTINETIESLNRGSILPIKEMKKKIKEAFKGEERILVGYLISTETGFGRSMVIDLEIKRDLTKPDYDNRIRQVDHRSLNWLVHKNTKYTVKK
jgi:hypothetical protein